MRIGIDVGGTHTDAVLMNGAQVIAWHKTPTSADVTTGIVKALENLLAQAQVAPAHVRAVLIGTTHFTNAVVERRRLIPTACVRLGLPASAALPPMVDWPPDLRETLGHHVFMAHGGHEFDGREISPFDERELRTIARTIRARGIRSVAIASIFSPIDDTHERRAAEIIAAEVPAVALTLSAEIGRIGLLERENAALLNACLRELATTTIGAFTRALDALQIRAPLYLSQNDGTLMSAAHAEKYPVLTFASGPTNSMRGAAFLAGLQEAVVVDIGGTTTDVGVLAQGFPREAALAVTVGGVRTNFRMPDVYSFGLGGGSIVQREPLQIGPQSVGYELPQRALIFGGDVLTSSDIAVAAGLAAFGEPARVRQLDSTFVRAAVERIQRIVEETIDQMKTSAAPLPVILVGGGSVLVGQALRGASEVIRPPHYAIANAIGAAIAQVGGEIDRVYALNGLSRAEALAHAQQDAIGKVLAAGGDLRSVKVVDVEAVPLAYLPGSALRVRVKAVADLQIAV